jgi:cytosine permease
MSTGIELESQQKSQQIVDVTGDYARHCVPPEKRKSLFSIAMVTAGFTICMSGLFTGAAMAKGLSLRDAILANIIGNIILAAYSGLTAAIGAKYGVSSTMLCRHAFGRKGAIIIGLLWAITLTGWYSVQCGFFGQTMNSLLPNAGFITNIKVATFWGGILMMLTAVVGFSGLMILSNIGIPTLLVVATIGIYLSTKILGAGHQVPLTEHYTLAQGVVMAVGSFAVGGVIQADLTRYAKSVRDSWLGTLFGFLVGNAYIITAGIIMVKATGADNLPGAMMQVGLGALGLLVLIIAQWTTNDNNLYASALGLTQLIPNVKKSVFTACLGILATLIGVAGFYEKFVPFLIVLGSVIPPVAGVIIADYYLIKKEYSFGAGTRYANVNISAFISIIAGALVGLFVKQGLPSINAIIVAFLVHWALMSMFRQKVEVGESIEDEKGF